MLEILKKHDEHKSHLDFLAYSGYESLGCIEVQSVEMLEKDGKKYNIMDENLPDISYTSIYKKVCSYTHYDGSNHNKECHCPRQSY